MQNCIKNRYGPEPEQNHASMSKVTMSLMHQQHVSPSEVQNLNCFGSQGHCVLHSEEERVIQHVIRAQFKFQHLCWCGSTYMVVTRSLHTGGGTIDAEECVQGAIQTSHFFREAFA